MFTPYVKLWSPTSVDSLRWRVAWGIWAAPFSTAHACGADSSGDKSFSITRAMYSYSGVCFSDCVRPVFVSPIVRDAFSRTRLFICFLELQKACDSLSCVCLEMFGGIILLSGGATTRAS
jgi:hypothetical protein